MHNIQSFLVNYQNVYKPRILVCPPGYTPMVGDVAGQALKKRYDASLEQCANDCNTRSDCNSFAHSLNENDCKLMEEQTPTHPKYKDYQFCSKIMTGYFYMHCT